MLLIDYFHIILQCLFTLGYTGCFSIGCVNSCGGILKEKSVGSRLFTMAMNKLMHPRNPYKKRPDFKQLAIEFPEFRKYAKQDLTGKINFNFKDHGAVWALTKCLLQRDFDLNVEIVPGHLVPTLPLRLNYLLWIEDLLSLYKPKNVIGIDIGTGSNCIYPLLAAKKFNWSMLCTEIDIESTKCALGNVENNYLSDKITVKAVTEDIILIGALDEDTFYDFCMCNPPFFADSEELSMESKSRSPSRKGPNNAPTGVPSELITPGGESVFIARIIADSCQLKERVRIYTVMVGKKSTLKPLKEMLRESEACSIATTMFCQGRTTRWGLAWTFIPGLDLNQLENAQKKSKVSYIPFQFRIEKSDVVTMQSTLSKLTNIFKELQIETDQEESGDSVMMTIKAFENTWINSRKKRRMEKKKQKQKEKAADAFSFSAYRNIKSSEKAEEKENATDPISTDNNIKSSEEAEENEKATDPISTYSNIKSSEEVEEKEKVTDPISIDSNIKLSEEAEEKVNDADADNDSEAIDNLNKTEMDFSQPSHGPTDEHVDPPQSLENSTQEMECTSQNDSEVSCENKKKRKNMDEYLVASILLKECEELNDILFELYFIEGSGGKDAANQIFTFVRNRIK